MMGSLPCGHLLSEHPKSTGEGSRIAGPAGAFKIADFADPADDLTHLTGTAERHALEALVDAAYAVRIEGNDITNFTESGDVFGGDVRNVGSCGGFRHRFHELLEARKA
jgi:hypothetical protein